MFEKNLSPNNQTNQANLPRGFAQKSSSPPPNLPVGNFPSAEKVPEDILADVDIEKSAVKRPAQPDDLGLPPTPPEPEGKKTEIKEPFFKKNQKILVLAGTALVIVGGIGFAGWFLYGYFTKPVSPLTKEPPAIQNQNLNQPPVNQNANINQPAVISNANLNQAVPPVDTDLDGLSDDEEAMYGTNPTKVDTDDDSLTDRDEVKVFKTDPTNPDSDGDGFKDGEEVRKGYDPKGTGKLLKVQ